MRYDKVRKNTPRVLSITSLTVAEFEALVPTFKHHWDEYYSHYTLKGKVCERISYGRKTGKLPLIADKLLFILSCLKNSPLQDDHGSCYDMTQPQCNEWIHWLADILRQTLKTLGELPERNAACLQYILQQDVLLDGTERPIQRPQDEDRQKSCYSGKKTHNVKNNLLCNAQKRILWLSRTFDSSVHDKKITDEQPLCLPAGITWW
jgi:hypothetical protein